MALFLLSGDNIRYWASAMIIYYHYLIVIKKKTYFVFWGGDTCDHSAPYLRFFTFAATGSSTLGTKTFGVGSRNVVAIDVRQHAVNAL